MKEQPRELKLVDPLDGPNITNNYEFMTDIISVHSDLQKEISNDLILAHFQELSDHDGIIRMQELGAYTLNMFDDVFSTKIPYWDHELEVWKERGLYVEEAERITKSLKDMANAFLLKSKMKAILNRNKKENPLLDKIFGNIHGQPLEEQRKETIMDRFKAMLGTKKNKEEEPPMM